MCQFGNFSITYRCCANEERQSRQVLRIRKYFLSCLQMSPITSYFSSDVKQQKLSYNTEVIQKRNETTQEKIFKIGFMVYVCVFRFLLFFFKPALVSTQHQICGLCKSFPLLCSTMSWGYVQSVYVTS